MAFKGLHVNNLDFEVINTGNEKTLVLIDSSTYFEKPQTPLLDIKLPGFAEPFTVNIEFSQINILTSSTIGITNLLNNDCIVNLPDGVYELTYRICPYKYQFITKNHLRTETLETELDKIFCSLDCNTLLIDNPKIKRDISDILILIESAKANVRGGYCDKGTKDYQLAKKKVLRLLDYVKDNK